MREVEVKFPVTGDFVLPDLSDGVGPVKGTRVPPTGRRGRYELRATYLDTHDLRLARAGITMRRRTGGPDEGWHVKLPTGRTGVREEVQRPLAGEDPPEDLLWLVRARVRHAPLRPVVTLVTDRTALVLTGADGEDLAEVVDDVVRVMDDDHVSAQFREVEVEDRGGGPDVLAAVGEVLESAGAVRGGTPSKLLHALGPAADAPPDPPPPPAVGPRMPAGLVVTAALRRHVARLLAEDPRVRLDEDDAVHQMRVAARRLRSVLRTFAPLLDTSWAQSLGDELRWLGQALGDARDLEVLRSGLLAAIDGLEPDTVRGHARTRVERQLSRDLSEATARAVQALESDRYVDLLDRLVDGATTPPLTEDAEVPARLALPPLVKAEWKRLRKRAGRVLRGPSVEADPADLHAMRIAAKRTRYAAEDVAPALGKGPRKLARRCEDLQDHLGAHQDAVVAAEALLDLAGRRGIGAAAFTLGVLHAREEARALVLRGDVGRMWAEVSRPKHRRWITSS